MSESAASACSTFFVTPNCLVRCGDDFLDQCRVQDMCGATTATHLLMLGNTEFKLPSWRKLVSRLPPATKLDSMRWPAEIPAREHGPADDPFALAQELAVACAPPPPADEEWHALLAAQLQALAAREHALRGEQDNNAFHAPGVFGNELVDYWPGDAQEPVGYHPTTACGMADTNARGFVAHMTADARDGNKPTLDHTRPRNATAAATFAGAAHLLCDDAVYGAHLAAPDGLYLETRWGGHAADPAVPRPTMAEGDRAWTVLGAHDAEDQFAVPALEDAADVAADPRPRAAAGLVRDWLNVHGRAAGSAPAPWPHHWERAAWYGTHEDTPESCPPIELARCVLGASDACGANAGLVATSALTAYTCCITSCKLSLTSVSVAQATRSTYAGQQEFAPENTTALRTWRRDSRGASWTAQLCNTGGAFTSLLSPYTYTDPATRREVDTLAHTPSTVWLCTYF